MWHAVRALDVAGSQACGMLCVTGTEGTAKHVACCACFGCSRDAGPAGGQRDRGHGQACGMLCVLWMEQGRRACWGTKMGVTYAESTLVDTHVFTQKCEPLPNRACPRHIPLITRSSPPGMPCPHATPHATPHALPPQVSQDWDRRLLAALLQQQLMPGCAPNPSGDVSLPTLDMLMPGARKQLAGGAMVEVFQLEEVM